MKKLSTSSLTLDTILQFIVGVVFFGWNLLEGAVFENEYPLAMVRLYEYPIWRIVLVLLLFLSTEWCYCVSIMIAYTVFFYIMDIEVTTDKWSLKDLKKSTS
jgi:hypothetical protein